MNGRGRYLSLDAYANRKKDPSASSLQNLYPGRPYPIGYGFGIPNDSTGSYEMIHSRRNLYEKNYDEWLNETVMSYGLPQQPARPAVPPDQAFQNPNTFSSLIKL